MRKLVWFLAAVSLLGAMPLAAQEAGTEKGKMFIRLTASDLTLQNTGLILAYYDLPVGSPGKVVDASWNARITPEILVGFMFPENRGTLQFRFFQFDESLDIGGHGHLRNVWGGELGVYDEDLDGDGDVDGFDCGTGSVPGGTIPCEDDGDNDVGDSVIPNLKDGAEDDNRNEQRDLVPFSHSDTLLAQDSSEIVAFDVEYARKLKEGKRFRLDWSAGLRFARVYQNLGISYRENSYFAAYTDNPGDSVRGLPTGPEYIDADGDGNTPSRQGTVVVGDKSGDGWGNGNGRRVSSCQGTGSDTQVGDDLIAVPIVNEDRVTASVRSEGLGVVLGLRGETWLTRDPAAKMEKKKKKGFARRWSLESGIRIGILKGDQDWAHEESFTRERDALPNFINWDFNQDGVYGWGPHGHDFDFNGDGVVNDRDWDLSLPIPPDRQAWDNRRIPVAAQRLGIRESVRGRIDGGRCLPPGQQHPYDDGFIDEGDPIAESERNTSIVRTSSVASDAGSRSRTFTSLDVDVGLRYRFSRFADLSFGVRASRWFDVGTLKALPPSGSARALAEGDLTMEGLFLTLTVWPRL